MAALKGKVAWITGGGSGIGLAGAIALAGEGAQVVITGRTKTSLDSGLAEAKQALAELPAEDRVAVKVDGKGVLREFSGKVSGTRMEGSFRADDGTEGRWSATKK